MSNPNPNLVKVWSPTGEMAEVSRANARDLTTHAGWHSSPPVIIEKVVEVAKTEEPADEVVETQTEAETPAETEAEAVTETPAEEAAGDEGDDEDEAAGDEEADASENVPTVRKTEEDFADLESREDVVAYLAAAFPDFKPHHLSKRDGLVQKAIELATA